MIFNNLVLSLHALTLAAATPTILQKREDHLHSSSTSWSDGAITEFEFHESCNQTQINQLKFAFEETEKLAAHARDHVLRWGNESAIYRKYFGNNPPFEVIGAFSMIVDGDKAGLPFRCDDPDGNCEAMPDWAGHWRGSNATSETVICPLSFEERRELSQVCALGYNVAESSRLIFWASDMIHRLFHLPSIGYGYIEHYLDGYEEIIEEAASGHPNTTHDSDVLQYFALDAWAYDIAVPHQGCPGPAPVEPESGVPPASEPHTHMVNETPSASEPHTHVASETHADMTSTVVSAAAEASEDCHTHSDGEVHCV